MNKSPLMVQMAFAHANSPLPIQYFSDKTWDSEPAKECRKELKEQGLIGEDGLGTDKLRFWVDYVCKIPWPKQNFIIPLEPDLGPLVWTPYGEKT